jgi:glutathione S-transferase
VPELTLVSHALCPYVQRAAIVLLEKGELFGRRWVDLAHKPDWFLQVSPLGKTPVLLVDREPVFESAVICEYLDEVFEPRLHPQDALLRAKHRAWMEFGSSVLSTIWAYYTAPDAESLQRQRDVLLQRFVQLEAAVDARGPFFAGEGFCVVDAVFAPVFRYFDAFEAIGEPGFFDAAPRVRRWRAALGKRASVREAVLPDFDERLLAFLRSRDGELGRRANAAQAAAG